MSVTAWMHGCIAILLLFSGAVSAYDVLVSVTGSITGNTCTVAGNSESLSVDLGTVATNQFRGVGDVGNYLSPFTIRLEECGPTFNGVRVSFSASPDDNNSDVAKNSAGDASGIGIQLLDHQKNPLALNAFSTVYGANQDSGVEMRFYARLIATQQRVTAGTLSATATYTLEYQ